MKTLRELRKAKSMTQQKLGEMLGVTSQAIANFENAKRTPDVIFAKKYAKALGVSLEELVESFEVKQKKFNST